MSLLSEVSRLVTLLLYFSRPYHKPVLSPPLKADVTLHQLEQSSGPHGRPATPRDKNPSFAYTVASTPYNTLDNFETIWQNVGRQSIAQESRGLYRVPQRLANTLPCRAHRKAASGEGGLQADKGMQYCLAVHASLRLTVCITGTRFLGLHPSARRQVLPHT